MAFRTDLEALVLGVLQTEGLHGYEIAKRINFANGEVFRVGESKLYPTLHKLEEEGFVEAEWLHDDTRKPRKVYVITERGLQELEKKQKAWQSFVAGVSSLLMKPQESGNG